MQFHRPSVRLQEEESQNDEGEGQFTVNNVFADDCRVSNDPPAKGASATPELRICDVTSFRCVDASNRERNTELLEVPYDYEVHYNPDADFDMILPYLEEAVLEHMATAMGVRNCVASMGVRRRLQNFTEEQLDRLQGVSLYPKDEPDQRYDSCAVNVVEIADKTECIPIQGATTVYLKLSEQETNAPEDLKDEMRKAILDFLETSMTNDVYTAPGNIEKVTFIGNRTALEAASAQKSSSNAYDGGLSSLAKGLISGAAILIFLILLILCCVCRKRRKGTGGGREMFTVKSEQALPAEEDGDNYHRRRRRGSKEDAFVPGSLAFTDSLALKPQDFDSDKFVDEGSYATAGTASVTLSRPEKTARSPDSSLEESFPSMELSDYMDYQLSAISEATSPPESLVNSGSPMNSGSLLNSGSLVSNSMTRSYSWDDDYSEDYETSSSSTPRRILQMT